PYQGWVFGWTTANLAATPSIYCASPDGGQGGIWQSGRGLVGDASGNVYCATGNGVFNGTTTTGDKGMALLKLSSTLTLLDSFNNGNAVNESNADDDFASGGPLLVPGTTRLVMAGKPGNIFVCDTANLGGYTLNANNCIQAITGANGLNPGSDGNAQAPVYWNGPSGPTVYYWAGRNANNFPRAYRYNTTTNQLTVPAVSTGTVTQGGRAGGISLSANGNIAGTGILWSIKSDSGGNSPPGPGRLIALNAEDLTVTLWDSNQNTARDSLGNYSKLSYPTIANGRVYVPTLNASDATNYIAVYGLINGTQALRLAFTTQPTTTAPGDVIPTFRVSVLDSNDQVVNTATNAITVSLGNNPGGATLSGTLTVNAVNGVATFSNVIVNNIASGYTLIAKSTFTDYTAEDIGGPGVAGSSTAVVGGYDLVGGGGDTYGTSDQFHFKHRTVTGDFDVRVRVASVTDTNLYTKSGLMAREGNTAGARNALAIVFPKNAARNLNNGGYEYQFRNTTNGTTTANHPQDAAWYSLNTDVLTQPPNSWVRLARTGTTIRAYFSYDGFAWTQYTTSDATGWPAALEVGLAECAHDNATSATGQFRSLSYNGVTDFGSVTSSAFDVQTGIVALLII
ncbi:MAG TPA: hypothetical protein VHX44_19895, partial [Planctomycetota bacterium]|nr:hypothetical protein [Planctomycetota bacterium]